MERQSWVVPPPPTISLPVVGSGEAFAVRRIYCVVRNYDEHIRELANSRPDQPVFFTKQRDELVPGGGRIAYPPATADYQHEVEMVVALKSGGLDIPERDALSHIYGYAVGLDMTRRDMQQTLKEGRFPWGLSKSFDQAAPCGAITPALEIGQPSVGSIRLFVNDEVRQQGDLAHLIWGVPALIAALSSKVRLEAGDLIFTGTPSGVGPVRPGDRLHAEIDGLAPLDLEII